MVGGHSSWSRSWGWESSWKPVQVCWPRTLGLSWGWESKLQLELGSALGFSDWPYLKGKSLVGT